MAKPINDPEYHTKYGNDEDDIVETLSQQVSQLVRQWRLYLYFYSTEEKRLQVLKEASYSTAKVLSNAILDSTILKIRSLADEHETGRKKNKDSNLSLQHLVFISEGKKIEGLRADWVKLREKCKPIRNHSNKRIGHHDFDHALGKKASEMEFPEITDSVESMAAFVLKFHGDVRNTEWVSMPIVGAKDEKQFLWTLLLGNQTRNTLNEEAILRRITKNSPDYHKFSPPLWLGNLDPFAELFDF